MHPSRQGNHWWMSKYLRRRVQSLSTFKDNLHPITRYKAANHGRFGAVGLRHRSQDDKCREAPGKTPLPYDDGHHLLKVHIQRRHALASPSQGDSCGTAVRKIEFVSNPKVSIALEFCHDILYIIIHIYV
jgi:hypothetical protein